MWYYIWFCGNFLCLPDQQGLGFGSDILWQDMPSSVTMAHNHCKGFNISILLNSAQQSSPTKTQQQKLTTSACHRHAAVSTSFMKGKPSSVFHHQQLLSRSVLPAVWRIIQTWATHPAQQTGNMTINWRSFWGRQPCNKFLSHLVGCGHTCKQAAKWTAVPSAADNTDFCLVTMGDSQPPWAKGGTWPGRQIFSSRSSTAWRNGTNRQSRSGFC